MLPLRITDFILSFCSIINTIILNLF
jgi:hypothetical protein